MNYREWEESVTVSIKNDPLWKMDVYRLALFVGDIGWSDALMLSKHSLTSRQAEQLYASLGSISVNITEGYSRSKGLDRARFFEYALGSARESRDWYYKSRHIPRGEVIQHRIELLTQIIGMLVLTVKHQRQHSIREEQAKYSAMPQSSTFRIDTEVPMP